MSLDNKVNIIEDLGVGYHTCGHNKGEIQISKNNETWVATWTSNGETHNPRKGSAYVIYFDENFKPFGWYKTVLSAYEIHKEEEKRSAEQFISYKIQVALTLRNKKPNKTSWIKRLFNI